MRGSSPRSTRRYFSLPVLISQDEMDAGMDAGPGHLRARYPAGFQRDVLAGTAPTIQLNVDATRMTPGLHRQRLHPAHRHRRGGTISLQRLPRRRRAAGRTGAAGALQPAPQQGAGSARSMELINNDHHAVDHPHRRGADPRARARHHRASAGDAGDAGRDHGQQGLVDGAGRAGRRLRCRCRSWCRACWRCRCRARWRCSWLGAALHLFATTSHGHLPRHRRRAPCRSSACC